MTKQIQRLFPDLLRIMPSLQHLILVQCIPNGIQFLHQFMCIRSNLLFIVPFGQGSRFEHLKDKYRMMRRQGTATLCYDVRMRDTVLVTHVHQSGNRVVHIFLDRIIDTPLTAG